MKKLTAILLLGLLLFNWCGYRLATAIMSQRASARLEARIDQKAYSESELVEVSIPLSVPYQLNQPEFERSYGEVEVDGRVYTHVMRKIENGHLILLCLPDEHREKIEKAGNDFYKNANGLDQIPGEKSGKSINKFNAGDFDDRLEQWDLSVLIISNNVNLQLSSSDLPQVELPVLVQPPDC